MHILFLAGREVSYPRNDVLLRALRRLGNVEAITENEPGSLTMRSLRIGLRAMPRLLSGGYDLVFFGFYGHLLAVTVGRFTRTPILFDAFLSTYDTLCFDRQRFTANSPAGRLAYWLDRAACRLARHVLLDTPQHIDYFVETFALPVDLFSSLPVGCNEELFYPRPFPSAEGIKVLFYTTFLPLHGVDVVLEAAGQLTSTPDVCFQILGNGQEYPRMRRLAEERRLTNVSFLPPVPISALPEAIAQADICLGGHFHTNPKADRVIPGKIYQILAMARPLIAADTTANRVLLNHESTAMLCEPDNPDGLAETIRTLSQDADLRQRLASNGRQLYEESASETVITQALSQILERKFK